MKKDHTEVVPTNVSIEQFVAEKEDVLELDYASTLGSKKVDTTIYEHLEEVIDEQTGEIVQRSRYNISKKMKTDDHVQLYLASISGLLDLDLSKREYDVMCALLQYILPRNNQILLDTPTRKKIAKRLEFSDKSNSVNKAIASLTAKKIIMKFDGSYYLSPFHFGKGDFNKVAKMRIKVEKAFDFETGDIVLTRSSTASYRLDESVPQIESSMSSQYHVVEASEERFIDPTDGVQTCVQSISVENIEEHECYQHIEPDEFLGYDDDEEKMIIETKAIKVPEKKQEEVTYPKLSEQEIELEKEKTKLLILQEENRKLELQIRLAELQKGQ